MKKLGRIEIAQFDEAELIRQKYGARIIEAYPVDVRAKSIEFERYVGLTTTYEKEGFKEALRRSERKAIVRYYVEKT